MRFLVTCGPTFEDLDHVRRLTNFSTGKLGIGLSNHLTSAGHQVTLLKGYYATCTDRCTVTPEIFTTGEHLRNQLRTAAGQSYDAVFHAAAVSDFAFGQIHRRSPDGSLQPLTSRKFSTRDGTLFAELIPTPKLISYLRDFFPTAKIFGWKYEVDGSRDEAISLGQKQIRENRTNYSVVNGPAYGDGFGIVTADELSIHCPDAAALYAALLKFAA